jgi:lipid-A-disaccharide synthase-like uncharacterized protein
MVCFCVVSPSFLLWFFFPPFFTVVLGFFLLLFLSPLLFRVRFPSLLFAHGSNKPTVFPLSIWETDFTCAKILLSYNAIVLTSILKSCQLIFSIYPTTVVSGLQKSLEQRYEGLTSLEGYCQVALLLCQPLLSTSSMDYTARSYLI